MIELELWHSFICDDHGFFYVTRPSNATTPVEASCPVCDANPWFNSDIDAGPYGMLGGQIVKCRCCSKATPPPLKEPR